MANLYLCGSADTSKIVSFSNGTDQEIFDMIQGVYAGLYTLDDIKAVWSVGDTRKIKIDAIPSYDGSEAHREQYITVAIAGFGIDPLENPVDWSHNAVVTLVQVDCLMDRKSELKLDIGYNNAENGVINTNSNVKTGWSGCERRNWCNTLYFNSLPAIWQQNIKSVVKSTVVEGYNDASHTETTIDKIFLPSATEVNCTNTYRTEGEGVAYPIFVNVIYQGKTKLPIWNTNYVGSNWWLRTPNPTSLTSYYSYHCYVTGDDPTQVGIDQTSARYGIAPMFCI